MNKAKCADGADVEVEVVEPDLRRLLGATDAQG
jgi:hypothetical protein